MHIFKTGEPRNTRYNLDIVFLYSISLYPRSFHEVGQNEKYVRGSPGIVNAGSGA
jgi:hypothetical protein